MNDDRDAYLRILRDRRSQLDAELDQVRKAKDEFARRQMRLEQQLCAIDSLLDVELNTEPDAGTEDNGRALGSAPHKAQPRATKSPPIPRHSPAKNGSGGVGEQVLAAAVRTLRAAGVPMHYQELADIVGRDAPLRGQDPAATLLAHLSHSGEQFQRVGRGIYWLSGEPLPPGIEVRPTDRPPTRRGKSRGGRR